MTEAGDYHFYWTGPFSQWQSCTFEIDGITYSSAEQAMMVLKAQLFKDVDTAALILQASEPGKQKALGRQVQGFSEAVWDNHKRDIVLRINRAKFGQNKGLRRKLFQTGSALLVEASPLDTIWGIGLDAATAEQTPPQEWPGQNLLGQILTQVRDELRALHPKEAATIGP